MNRFTSQLVFCSPDRILRSAVIEQDDNLFITNLISLDDQLVETSNTLFFDGILSGGITSLKQNCSGEELKQLTADFHYIDLRNLVSEVETSADKKPLVLDFGSLDMVEMNKLFIGNIDFLSEYSVFEIIAACVYYPAKILRKQTGIDINSETPIILWQNVDLVNKLITNKARMKNLNENNSF